MSIEAGGAKYAYITFLIATRQQGSYTRVGYASMFDAADSDDEAFGRGIMAAMLLYPDTAGWAHHSASPRRIDGIDWVGRHELEKIRPVE